MLNKIKILSSKIPQNSEGYILDIKSSKITNTSKNITIQLPFKLRNSELFNFELVINKDEIHLNFILDNNLLVAKFYDEMYVKDKNCIFTILKTSFKNNTKNHEINEFNKFYDIPRLVDNNYSKVLKNNIINLGDNYFNLLEEKVCFENNESLIFIKPTIYFVYGNIYNLHCPSDYKLCIIDDAYKFDQKNTIIDKNNFENIDSNIITNSRYIYISKDLFFSKRYVEKYKLFHSSYRTRYAYQNYKSYIDSNNIIANNIELYDNIIFLVKNVNKKLIKSHPFIYSKNKIIVVNTNICKDDIDKSYNILNDKYKNNGININNLLFKQSYLDHNKYYLHTIYNNSTKFYNLKLIYSNIITEFIDDTNYISQDCLILKEPIGNNHYIELDCGHKYIFNNYFTIGNKCHYCCNSFSKFKIRLSINQFKKDLGIGNNDDILFIYKKINNFVEFLDDNSITIMRYDDNITLDFDLNTYMIFDNKISMYDFINIKPNNIRLINPNKIIIFNYQ